MFHKITVDSSIKINKIIALAAWSNCGYQISISNIITSSFCLLQAQSKQRESKLLPPEATTAPPNPLASNKKWY